MSLRVSVPIFNKFSTYIFQNCAKFIFETVKSKLYHVGLAPWNPCFLLFNEKIAGRKGPALADPSHKVRQGDKRKYIPPRPRSISGRQSVFRHVLGRILVGRVCSTPSRVDFRSTECVPPRPVLISGRQSVFRHVLGRFPVSRVCSGTSRVDFRSAECVSPHPVSISGLKFSKVPHNHFRLFPLIFY